MISSIHLILLQVLPIAFKGEASEIPAVDPIAIAPFILLLLAVALMPLLARAWWEKYYAAVAIGLSCPTILYYVAVLHAPDRMMQSGMDYFSFIVLIGSLFVASGGIHINISGRASPRNNVVLLAIGAVTANILGTTGAAMVLIRPYLRANQYRIKAFHIVFFIFIVCNIGGALTPIGDPPLFLGYLRGVPFFWIIGNVWGAWLIAVLLLLGLFALLDTASFRKWRSEEGSKTSERILHERASAEGLHNLAFIALIVIAVFIDRPPLVREFVMIASAAASYLTTRKDIHRANEFNFLPLGEVAILFLGIFATMVPALDWLQVNASRLALRSAGQFFWGTGVLSSVLDNAPTYLTFLSGAGGLFVDHNFIAQVREALAGGGAAAGQILSPGDLAATVDVLRKYHPEMIAQGRLTAESVRIAYLIGVQSLHLKAISLGAVFFGAMTYIGNGPNFMVKSIAEHMGLRSPGFVAYIVRYSLPVLMPLFVLIWWLVFRG